MVHKAGPKESVSKKLPFPVANLDQKPKKNIPQGNVLDSSAPVFHKGKTRENPKKRLTTTRKVKNLFFVFNLNNILIFTFGLVSQPCRKLKIM